MKMTTRVITMVAILIMVLLTGCSANSSKTIHINKYQIIILDEEGNRLEMLLDLSSLDLEKMIDAETFNVNLETSSIKTSWKNVLFVSDTEVTEEEEEEFDKYFIWTFEEAQMVDDANGKVIKKGKFADIIQIGDVIAITSPDNFICGEIER